MTGTRACARTLCVSVVAVVLASLLLGGCSSGNKKPPRATPARPFVLRDVPGPLRGTVGSVCQIQGLQPVLASGLGFVVGLNGTGGLPLPSDVAAHMEREMRLQGIGSATSLGGSVIEGQTARQLLTDANTAVVIVQAAIPPGSPEGTSFDLYVRALNATSIEGGTLWTTDLRLGLPSAFRARQARIIAQGRGPIFINPFAEPGQETDGVTRTAGRILDGGVSTQAIEMILLLDNSSHSMARSITTAINARFPTGRGDRSPPAHGRDADSIRVRVPYAYRDKQFEFVQLLQHLPIDQTYPEATAKRLADALVREPQYGDEISWALQAVGPQARPFLRELYEHPEYVPRMAALRAGSGLNDPRAVPHLIEIAKRGMDVYRTAAISMLSKIDGGPDIEQSLKELLAEDDLTVRVAAYEALASRAEKAQLQRLVALERRDRAVTTRRPYEYLAALSRTYLPEGTMQGVSRQLVSDKFFLDRVPVGEPLIYITQQRVPRIVLFGEGSKFKEPFISSMWSDRLMITSDSPGEPLRVYYRTQSMMSRGEAVAGTSSVVTHEFRGGLTDLIAFMAHAPTPENPKPGLAFSYSEVVGALYGLYKDDAIDVQFSTERDRLISEIIRLSDSGAIELRPERAGESVELVVFDNPTFLPAAANEMRDPSLNSLLIPLRQGSVETGQDN
ncbi:MAG: flagellar basal body P-ring protein FlgI [Phycisphaeraceae bacterium]|nr:flagellar basal body P-ring protein FlgI [Phycisphaeraceae bacterium]MCW5763862.1 flagellar basal body P-ring protein FlgI [Phycisphaeraceae bacterium]